MTYLHRFWQILRFFHLADPANELPRNDPAYDKLQKVRPLIDVLQASFKTEYGSRREVTIYEAMIPYKGRLGYKQYMKDKPTKWGIKVRQQRFRINLLRIFTGVYFGRIVYGLGIQI